MSTLTGISIRRSSVLTTPNFSPILGPSEVGDYANVVSDDFLSWLTTPDPAGQYPIPCLETLDCYTTAEFSDAALVDFIRKKHSLPGIRAMKRLYVEFYRPQTVDVIGEVGDEILKDLHLDLRYPYSMALLLKEPVVFHPFAGIYSHQVPTHRRRPRQ